MLTAFVAALWAAFVAAPANAGASLTVTPLGWNVVGLDSNDVTAGPNQFPIGVRVCNPTGFSTSFTATWEWQSSNANVNLASGSPAAADPRTLANGACTDLYWTVEVKRTAAAYLTSRNFRVGVATQGSTSYTPANRQIYVEKLVSQNRNTVDSLTGPGIAPDTTQLLVGNEYTYTLKGSTATNGYEQVVFESIFDPSLFEIVSVSTSYAVNSSKVPNPNDQFYADACGWVNDYTAANYRSCTGTGKAGGAMTATIKVRVKGVGGMKVNSIIYDYSGSSYHYNSDYGLASKSPSMITKEPNPQLSIVKTATPTTFGAANDTLNYAITATNSGDVPLNSVTVTDPMFNALNCSPAVPVATLAVGSSITCTASYKTTQEDVEFGSKSNTATTTGVAPSGATITKSTTLRVPGPEPAPELSVAKTSDPATFAAAGESVKFTVVTTNTGNVKLSNVNVVDALPGLTNWTCNQTTPVAVFSPGDTVTCTGNYTTTQNDVDAGKIVNSVTASGTDARSNTVSRTTVLNVPGPKPAPKLAVVKSSEPATFSKPGESIKFSVVTTNTGNLRLANVNVVDQNQDVKNWTCAPGLPVATLQPLESIKCTGDYVTTQADVEAGKVVNAVQATGKDPANNTITGNTSIDVPGPAPAPKIVLSKAANVSSFGSVGEAITFTVVATNTGNVTLKNVAVTDQNPAVTNWSCGSPVATLAPEGAITCTGDYTTTQADVDAGKVTNVANVTGTAPDTSPVTATSTINVPGPIRNPELSVAKSSKPATFSAVGTMLTYTVVATNTGNVGLTNVNVTDLNAAVTKWSCDKSSASLAPGEKITCTGDYTTTQADVEAGKAVNSAQATGKDPGNNTVTGTGSIEVPGPPPAPKLSVAKSSNPVAFTAAGDLLTFTVTATNTGNVPLSNVKVADVTAANWSCSPSVPAASLAPGAKITCTGDYTITQTDVEAGKVTNSAKAIGTAPDSSVVNADVTIDVPGPTPEPKLSISKTSSPATFSSSGTTLTYTVVATNTGNVRLTNVTVSDLNAAVTNWSCPATKPVATLAPGATVTCTGDYVTTTSDVEAGKATNSASATGTNPSGGEVTSTVDIEVPGPAPAPKLAIVKSSSPTAFTAAGTTLTFTVTATNTGNVPLTKATVTDANAAVSNWICDPLFLISLLPGDKITCTGTYVTTQADVDAGKVTNAATAKGTAPDNSQIQADTTIDVPGPVAAPSLSITKSASVTTFSGPGTLIDYSVQVANTGNVTLSSVDVTDAGVSKWSCGTPTPTLAPGASITCTGNDTTTEADYTTGEVSNIASVTAKTPAGADLAKSANITIPSIKVKPAISITKTSNPTSFSAVGDKINFTFTLDNIGNTALSNVAMTDPMLQNAGSWTCGKTLATFDVGMSVQCGSIYYVTSADLYAGKIVNTANVSGFWDGLEYTDSSTIEVPGPTPAPGISLAKSANPSTFTKAGETITFTVVATNTGNVPLYQPAVSDPLIDKSAMWSCGAAIEYLNPGQTMSCSGTYNTVQADVDLGKVVNSASVTATGPGDKPVTGSANVTVPGPAANPALSLVKSASPSTFSKVGDKIVFSVVATNSGNVKLTGVGVTDSMTLTNWSCTPASTTPPTAELLPGKAMTCGGEYAVTEQDVQAGQLTNQVSVVGKDPSGGEITKSREIVVQGPPPTASIALTKTAQPTSFNKAGDVITYSIVATNTGNLRLYSPVISDALIDKSPTWSCTPKGATSLAAGEKLTCTGQYTVKQADVDAGAVDNTASVVASDPGSSPVNDSAALSVPGPAPTAELSVVKTSSPTSFTSKDQFLAFSVLVTNTGNTSLTDVAVTDSMPLTGWSCSPPLPVALAPGQSVSCSGIYQTTAADVDLGSVTNSVTATAKDLSGGEISKTKQITVPGPLASPAIALVKTATPVTFSEAGTDIAFSLVATNTGNVTLYNPTISDSSLDQSESWTCTSPATLAPGDTITCSATYRTVQADVDAGRVINSASVSATDPKQEPVTDATQITVPGPNPNPALALVKSSSPATFTTKNTLLTYSVTATNIGNLKLTNVAVTDKKSLTNWTCVSGSRTLNPGELISLNPGESITCTGEYTTTADDVDLGEVANAASVTGTKPGGGTITKDADVVVPGPNPNPTLAVVKTSIPTAFDATGQKVAYTVVTANRGNVTIKGVTVTDARASGWSCDETLPFDLPPGDVITCTGEHVTTQADMDAGKIVNTATAEGTAPNGDPVEETTELTVPGPKPAPFLSVVKSALPTAFTGPDDDIEYTVVVTNTGNVTLTGVTVTDSNPYVTNWKCTQSVPRTLNPGDAISCTGDYTTTQDDVNAGHADNSASAEGLDPLNKKIVGTGDIKVPGPALSPEFEVIKTASPATFTKVGDTIDYTVTTRNSGNVTLYGVNVTDDQEMTGWSCDKQLPVAEFQPDDTIECSGIYTITQADVNAGQTTNIATATGKDPKNNAVEMEGNVSPQGPQRNPVLTLTKTAEPATFTKAGEKLVFTVVATNEGNITLYGVAPVDDNPAVTDWTCSPQTPATLQPGESVECTGNYVTTDADVDAGKVFNSASASAEAPNGSAPEKSVEKEVDGPSAQPALTLTKSAKPETFATVGQIIDYTFLVKNTGNVTITNLAIDDPRLVRPAVCPVVTLASGAQTTCTGTYIVTQSDVDAGTVINTATATGTPARGDLTAPTSSVTITKNETNVADLSISQTNSGPIIVDNNARFTLTVANLGPGNASGVKVSDSLPKGLEYVSASGSDWNCNADGRDVTCTLAGEMASSKGSRSRLKDFPSGAKSSFDLFVRATEAARPSVVNIATVSSTTPDPNLSNNTSSSRLVVERKPQGTKKANKVEVKPGTLIIKPGESVAGRRIRAKVSCKPRFSNVAGQVSYCRVHGGKNGRLMVKAAGTKPVKVRVLFWAPGTKKYKPYRKVQTFVLKPKR